MTKVAGIQFEKDTVGRNTHVRIDLKKHGKEVMPLLQELGAIDDDEFERDWQRGLTLAEFKKEMHKRIDAWPDK